MLTEVPLPSAPAPVNLVAPSKPRPTALTPCNPKDAKYMTQYFQAHGSGLSVSACAPASRGNDIRYWVVGVWGRCGACYGLDARGELNLDDVTRGE